MFSLGNTTNFSTGLTEEALDKLNRHSFKIDEFFIAICLYNNWFSYLDRYFGNKTSEQKSVLMQPLVRRLVIDGYQEDYSKIRFTVEGARYMADISSSMTSESSTEGGMKVEVDRNKVLEEKTEFDEFVEKFLSYFPEKKRNDGGVTIRSNATDTKSKLLKFMNKYKYDKDTILKATANFISKLRGSYNYCPAAIYFILKDGSSQLATECQQVKDNGGEEIVSNPFEKLM